MNSFNTVSGQPLAIIKKKNGKGKGKEADGQTIYLSNQDINKDVKTFNHLELPEGERFQQIPNITKEREILVVCGASGSGKSTYCKNYCIEYHKTYKKRPIYLFSNLDEDETLDKLGYIQRILIGDNLLEDPLVVKDFKDCLVIFDDVEIITNKSVKNTVYQLLNEIAKTGRHFNISAIMITHASNGNELKCILNEVHYFVYFPFGQNLRYTLEKYIGIDSKQIKQIKDTNSRFACIHKNYPQFVITDRKMWSLAS